MVFIGSDAYVRHMLGQVASRVCKEVDQVMHLLRKDSQAAWIILSTAMAHQLDYSLIYIPKTSYSVCPQGTAGVKPTTCQS